MTSELLMDASNDVSS